MRRAAITAAAVACMLSCARSDRRTGEDLRGPAERYLSAVYGCRSELVDSLVSDSVVVSYPGFEAMLGTSALRGREAVRRFAERFCGRWTNRELTVHEAVQDGRRVVLVWQFRAVPTFVDSVAGSGSAAPQGWGGITFFRFDEEGEVVEEIGEESTPGPMARISR